VCIVIAVSKFLINYLCQKWWYLCCLFATARLGCDVYSGVKLHTQLSCGLDEIQLVRRHRHMLIKDLIHEG